MIELSIIIFETSKVSSKVNEISNLFIFLDKFSTNILISKQNYTHFVYFQTLNNTLRVA